MFRWKIWMPRALACSAKGTSRRIGELGMAMARWEMAGTALGYLFALSDPDVCRPLLQGGTKWGLLVPAAAEHIGEFVAQPTRQLVGQTG